LERALELLQGTVVSFGMKVCGQREDAEDNAQEVLLKTARYLPQFENPQALAVWLYKVAKNQCLMSRRKSRFAPERELSLEELMPEPSELERLERARQDSPEDSVLVAENVERLREAVLQLPPDYRLILVLHDMEELSTTEVAKIAGVREGTVRVRLHRARLFLRKQLAAPPDAANSRKPRATGRGSAARPDHRRRGRCRQLFTRLSDYLDDELDDSLCQELEKHLADCAPCEAFLSSLEQTVQKCRNYEASCSSPAEAVKVRRAVIEQYQQALAAMRAKPSMSPSRGASATSL
jgi:RNA polymerase sigma-70 factor (ECF subfamily)